MIRSYIFLFGMFLLVSCNNNDKVPSGILKPEKMEVVLWDIIKADAFTKEYIKIDTAKNDIAENLKLQQQIFSIHKVTKVDFYKSYDYYKANTKQFKAILDSMIAHAPVIETKKNKKIPLMVE